MLLLAQGRTQAWFPSRVDVWCSLLESHYENSSRLPEDASDSVHLDFETCEVSAGCNPRPRTGAAPRLTFFGRNRLVGHDGELVGI